MTNEQLAIELVKRGDITVTDEGHVMRNGRRRGNRFFPYPAPKRIDYRGKDGYHRLSLTHKKRTFIVYAHRLVWMLANGQIPDGLEVNHANRNKSINSLSNLELLTHAKNLKHSNEDFFGEKNSNAKLTVNNILEIRKNANGDRREMAVRYGVTIQTIGAIINRKRWAHI